MIPKITFLLCLRLRLLLFAATFFTALPFSFCPLLFLFTHPHFKPSQTLFQVAACPFYGNGKDSQKLFKQKTTHFHDPWAEGNMIEPHAGSRTRQCIPADISVIHGKQKIKQSKARKDPVQEILQSNCQSGMPHCRPEDAKHIVDHRQTRTPEHRRQQEICFLPYHAAHGYLKRRARKDSPCPLLPLLSE